MTKTLFVSEVYGYTHKLAQRLQEDYNKSSTANRIVFEITEGRKYYKLIEVNGGVHAFIDKKTGDVFKPASWSKPAPIPRFNLLINAQDCFNKCDCHGSYLYIR